MSQTAVVWAHKWAQMGNAMAPQNSLHVLLYALQTWYMQLIAAWLHLTAFCAAAVCQMHSWDVQLAMQGFCYVYYSNADAAAAAMDHLNGAEFPPSSGHRLKVGLIDSISMWCKSCASVSCTTDVVH